MQQRVPNQYKPSFFENLFSVFIPVPTRRILSDKRMEKQKKINLSLTDDSKGKSTKKIKISTSFESKATPSTHYRPIKNTAQPQNIQPSQKSRTTNRGLNFHPRKINFQNEHTLKPKIKSQLIMHPSPNQSITQKQSQQNSRNLMLTLNNRKEQAVGKYSLNNQNRSYTQCNHDYITKEKEKEDRNITMEKQQLKYCREQKNSKLVLAQLVRDSKLNPEFMKSCDKYVERHSFLNINKSEDNDRKREYQRDYSLVKKVQRQQTQQKQPSYLMSIPQSLIKTEIKTQQPPIKSHQKQQTTKQKTEIIETPKIDRHISSQQIKIKSQQSQNLNSTISIIIKDPSKPITNLFDKALTIQSKYDDQSSRKSESDCYSNVLYRVTGEEMANWRNTQRDYLEQEHQGHQFDEIRRKSLYANLMEKYQQNNQSDNQNMIKLEFKKKNWINNQNKTEVSKQNKTEVWKENYQNLSKLEDILVSSKLSVSPPSLAQKKNSQTNKIGFNLKIDSHDSSRSPYSIFQKISYLGVGRFASVYFCLDSSINFIFAMKQILKFTVKYNKIQHQLQKQIKIQHQCFHPNILNLYNAWSDDKKYYLAIEYGQTTLLKKVQSESSKGLNQPQCIEYLKQIIKGLDYLHTQNIVHRDIKPQNIIIVNGCCKIGDFGWATYCSNSSLIQACGTPCYISPQIQNLEGYTCKTDMWSLGVLAFQIVNGKLEESCFQSSGFDFSKLKFKSKVSQAYRNMVCSLLSQKEQDRPTAAELLNFPIFKQK